MRGMLYAEHRTSGLNRTFSLDSLSDGLTCSRDVPHLLKLGINTILTSGYNTIADHSACMHTFEEAGIYVIALLNEDIDTGYRINGSIRAFDDYVLHDRFFKIINSLAVHSNLLGFMVELGDFFDNGLQTVPTRKANIRDIKRYLRGSGHRNIPVGAHGHNHGTSTVVAEYMSCGEPEVAADFYGLPSSENGAEGILWCENSSAAYDRLAEQYRNFSLPVFVTYGCEANKTHDFQEVQYIYTGEPAKVFSGGIAFDWFPRINRKRDTGATIPLQNILWSCSYVNIGVVEIDGLDVRPRRSYWALSSQLAVIRPTPTHLEDYTPSNTASPCQNFTIRSGLDTYPNQINGELKISAQLPAEPNPRLCSCMMQTLDCIANPSGTMEASFSSAQNICSQNNIACLGVNYNATEGQYGSFQRFNLTERASWTYQQNYIAHGNDSAECSSAGGVIRQATPLPSLANDCQVLLRQAGPDGTGTVTSTPLSLPTEPKSFVSPTTNSLHTGAKVGIGIGISCFVILCLLLGTYLWARKRRARAAASIEEYQKAELPDTFIQPGVKDETLLDSTEVGELGGSDVPVEVSGDSGLVEASGEQMAELPTSHNEKAELDGCEVYSRQVE
jgi:hypothetical protein